MYEAVYARPAGDGELEAFASTASSYGFSGLVVRGSPEVPLDDIWEPGGVDAGGTDDGNHGSDAAPGIDVVDGVEVRTEDPEAARRAVDVCRGSRTLVVVRGGTNRTNRYAVEDARVDVLARPTAGRGDLNHVLVRAAADNGVRIEVDLAPVLRASGGRRVRHLQSLRKLHELVDYYDAPYVVSAGPTDPLQLRAPRELAAVGDRIGVGGEWLERGLAEWGRLAARNRRIDSESFIEPGVERGRYE